MFAFSIDFFFNDTATTEIYTLSLHAALPISTNTAPVDAYRGAGRPEATFVVERLVEVTARRIGMDPAKFRKRNYIKKDRKSTRLNSSHANISYAVFCLKKN